MKNTALITWASSGIWKEFAYIHAQNKSDVVLVARRIENLEKIKQDLESKYKIQVYIIQKDLTQKNAVDEIYQELQSENINIEILINNAGFGWIGKFHQREWKQDESMIDLNIKVLTQLTRLFLPDFIQRNSGKILNVSSTASLIPWPMQAVYYATKAYVTSLSNAISQELENTNVTLTNLMPGATKSEFWAKSGMDKTSLFDTTATAQSVAQDWYDAMMAGKRDIISGITGSQKILLFVAKFLPKSFMLKQVYDRQQIKK